MQAAQESVVKSNNLNRIVDLAYHQLLGTSCICSMFSGPTLAEHTILSLTTPQSSPHSLFLLVEVNVGSARDQLPHPLLGNFWDHCVCGGTTLAAWTTLSLATSQYCPPCPLPSTLHLSLGTT